MILLIGSIQIWQAGQDLQSWQISLDWQLAGETMNSVGVWGVGGIILLSKLDYDL